MYDQVSSRCWVNNYPSSLTLLIFQTHKCCAKNSTLFTSYYYTLVNKFRSPNYYKFIVSWRVNKIQCPISRLKEMKRKTSVLEDKLKPRLQLQRNTLVIINQKLYSLSWLWKNFVEFGIHILTDWGHWINIVSVKSDNHSLWNES